MPNNILPEKWVRVFPPRSDEPVYRVVLFHHDFQQCPPEIRYAGTDILLALIVACRLADQEACSWKLMPSFHDDEDELNSEYPCWLMN